MASKAYSLSDLLAVVRDSDPRHCIIEMYFNIPEGVVLALNDAATVTHLRDRRHHRATAVAYVQPWTPAAIAAAATAVIARSSSHPAARRRICAIEPFAARRHGAARAFAVLTGGAARQKQGQFRGSGNGQSELNLRPCSLCACARQRCSQWPICRLGGDVEVQDAASALPD